MMCQEMKKDERIHRQCSHPARYMVRYFSKGCWLVRYVCGYHLNELKRKYDRIDVQEMYEK